MARRVFFSFHYARDVRRIVQVRNSWVVRPEGEAQPFFDAAAFEQAKERAGGIERWIENQLQGASVTAVLFGAETCKRKWVLHEIKRSHELKKGILAIDIHRIKDPQHGEDSPGENPLDYVSDGRRLLSSIYKSYDWVLDGGYSNMPRWIEQAARAAGR